MSMSIDTASTAAGASVQWAFLPKEERGTELIWTCLRQKAATLSAPVYARRL
jgi:hypothetical protein